MAGEILLGFDGTDGARCAAREAVALAKAFDTPLVVGFAYEVSPLGGEAADLRDTVKEIGENRLEEAMALAREAGVPAEAVLIPDHPAKGLAALAEERGARMIVVGTNGETPIAGAILGSTPHKLLHLAAVPVVVVRR